MEASSLGLCNILPTQLHQLGSRLKNLGNQWIEAIQDAFTILWSWEMEVQCSSVDLVQTPGLQLSSWVIGKMLPLSEPQMLMFP